MTGAERMRRYRERRQISTPILAMSDREGDREDVGRERHSHQIHENEHAPQENVTHDGSSSNALKASELLPADVSC